VFSPLILQFPSDFFWLLLSFVMAGNLPAVLDPSRASKADYYLAAFDYYRHVALAAACFKHPLHIRGIGLHVYVLDLMTPFGVVLTGRRGIRSRILSKDQNLFAHRSFPFKGFLLFT